MTKIDQLPTVETPKSKELIEAKEGLVFEDQAAVLESEDFHQYQVADKIPSQIKDLIRPIVVKQEGVDDGDSKQIDVKALPAMGRASFVEREFDYNGEHFNFLQWKGTGYNSSVRENFGTVAGIQADMPANPLSETTPFPFLRVKGKGIDIMRHTGGSNFRNVKNEADKSVALSQLTGNELRTPPVLATFAFSRSYAEKNGLPLPSEEDPLTGETAEEYKKRTNTEAEHFGSEHYDTLILGENVRAIRNPWRVKDVENVLNINDPEQKQEQLRMIVDLSKKVFEKEFKKDLTDTKYLAKLSQVLAEQSLVLIEHGINQGALNQHKQDISLGGEICDLDGATIFEKDKQTEARDAHSELELFQQMLKIAAHLRPMLEAIQELNPDKDLTDEKLADLFVGHIKSSPRWEKIKNRFNKFNESKFATKLSHEGIVGKDDQQAKENFAGQEEYLNKIVELLKEE